MKLFTKGRVFFLLFVVVFIGLFFAGKAIEQRLTGAQDKTPKYRTAVVDRGSIVQFVTATGTLNPVGLVNIGTQVSGTLNEVSVDFNSPVKKGQLLAKIDDTLIRASINQATASLGAAQAQLALAESTHTRNTKLVAQGFLSAATLDQSRQALDAARAQIQVNQAQLDRAKADLNNTLIRSPIDGVVIKRTADLGQTVAASFQTPNLFQIARDLKKMQIDTNVSEADVGQLKEGQVARFVVDAFPERDFEGKVRQFRLAANVQQNVVTYNVVIDVDNPDELLKPGLTAQVRIITSNKPDVLRVPTAALRYRPSDFEIAMAAMEKRMKGGGADTAKKEKDAKTDTKQAANEVDNTDELGLRTKSGERLYRLYKLENNEVKPVEVVIGIANSKYTEIVKGSITAGDQVITRSLIADPTKQQ
jgi:HlyD family secretion protein